MSSRFCNSCGKLPKLRAENLCWICSGSPRAKLARKRQREKAGRKPKEKYIKSKNHAERKLSSQEINEMWRLYMDESWKLHDRAEKIVEKEKMRPNAHDAKDYSFWLKRVHELVKEIAHQEDNKIYMAGSKLFQLGKSGGNYDEAREVLEASGFYDRMKTVP
jgi:hypothetical protein